MAGTGRSTRAAAQPASQAIAGTQGAQFPLFMGGGSFFGGEFGAPSGSVLGFASVPPGFSPSAQTQPTGQSTGIGTGGRVASSGPNSPQAIINRLLGGGFAGTAIQATTAPEYAVSGPPVYAETPGGPTRKLTDWVKD